MKGIIALDIDGTITIPGHRIAPEVIHYLHELARQKWQILIITGRTLKLSQHVVHDFTFPYYLAVQNGAILLEMPLQRIVAKKYLHKDILPIMHQICEGEPTDCVIYAGCEHQDLCFYRPQYFSDELREYIQKRSLAVNELLREVSSFDLLDFDQFPSIKCFGLHQPALTVAQRIEKQLGLHVPLIRDPFNPTYYVAQATHSDVSKGHVLQNLKSMLGSPQVVIAAGDDYNDNSMLAVANIKVVMASAPADMLSQADIIAPPAEKLGIISGLQEALLLSKKHG